MKGNLRAIPPQPALSEREKRLINLLVEDGSNASDKCVADFLCNCYPDDNNHFRTHEGVRKYRTRFIGALNTLLTIH